MSDIELVIKIPEEVYKSIQDNDYCGISNSDMYNALKNGTPIPDNATNGDVIKAIFPNSDIEEHRTYMKIVVGDYLLPCAYQWWNSPYQKGGKE